jgi:hypothetical protein
MNKRDKIDREIKAIAVIEDEFKAFGKLVYTAWKSPVHYDFENIMVNFDNLMQRLLKSKLKETKCHTKTK